MIHSVVNKPDTALDFHRFGQTVEDFANEIFAEPLFAAKVSVPATPLSAGYAIQSVPNEDNRPGISSWYNRRETSVVISQWGRHEHHCGVGRISANDSSVGHLRAVALAAVWFRFVQEVIYRREVTTGMCNLCLVA